MKRLAAAMIAASASACGLLTSLDDLGGGDAAQEASTEAGSDAGADVQVVGDPPPRPDGGVPTAQLTTFALRSLDIGDVGPDGGATTLGWQTLGYNLDGKVTTSTSTDVCAPVSGASTDGQVDGFGGIDNAFVKSILPLVKGISSSAFSSAQVSQQLGSGAWTLLIEIDGLGNDPAQTAVGLTAQVFEGAALSSAPAFDATTQWPVLSSSLVDGATFASGAKVTFGAAYVSNGTFVSASTTAPLPLRLVSQGNTFTMMLHHPIITFAHASPDVGAGGIVAGVLDTQELITTFQQMAGRVDTSLCSGPTIQSLLTQLAEASDMFADGTNSATGTCSGISIAFGFEARVVANPSSVTQAPAPPPDPCGD